MKINTLEKLKELLKGSAEFTGQEFKLIDEESFKANVIDQLVYQAVFATDPKIRAYARWMIRKAGIALSTYSASIADLYEDIAKGKLKDLTVPAINIRGMTYDVARSIFKVAKKNRSGAFIFEIAKSEIEYTYQRPAEFSAVILAAAIKEGYKGPVFIQGDHFQVNAKKFHADKDKELKALQELIKEAIEGGFYNIDIDTSTLVDLSHKTLDEQQRLNYEIGAILTVYLRSLEPGSVNISVGGEIGEVGEQNSTKEELIAYMEGYNKALAKSGNNIKGISKVSVQTGTSHGGVPLPDGSIAEVALDFDTLNNLGKIAREKYHLSGAVQHGASTLPDSMFHKFPRLNTSEIHLATGFQNMIYDSAFFPDSLREQIYKGLREEFGSEKKSNQTDEQFIYKTRKKGFGLAKHEIWSLDSSVKEKIEAELEEKFEFLFKQLDVVDTYDTVLKVTKKVMVNPNLAKEIEWAEKFNVRKQLEPGSPNED